MPRTINTQGVPKDSVHAFMHAIVNYERTIGAELDEGHIALARSIWMARQDRDEATLKRLFLSALTAAGIIQLGEGVYRLIPAARVFNVDEAAFFKTPIGEAVLRKDALDALSTLCEIASNSATTTAAVYEVDRLRLVVQRTIGVPPVDANNVTIEDYKEALADKALLTRELDVLLNGAGAAKQAALCDIVAQVRNEGIRSKNYRES